MGGWEGGEGLGDGGMFVLEEGEVGQLASQGGKRVGVIEGVGLSVARDGGRTV